MICEPLLLDCTAFHPSCSSGGVSVYMQEILGAIGDDLKFTAFFKDIEPGILESCGPAIGSSSRVTGNMLVWRDRAVRAFARNGAKGVWFPTQFSAWVPAVPSVVTIHDMAAYLAWRSFGAVARVYMPATLLASSLHASRILVVSESSADDMNRLFPWTKRRTLVTRHGLPSDVRRKAMEIGIDRHRKEGPFSFIFLDGANPRKRLDLCLLALEKLGWSNLELKITGNPDRVSERIHSILGKVPAAISLVGRLERDDLLDALACADLLLYPSDFEGFGFPLIESMAFGTSVVSLPGNAEREVGGHFAIYSAAPEADALLDAIRTAMERCRDAAWQRSLMAHSLSFTWEDSIRIHREVLQGFAS
jgi:glycosyltransferase involved in cell wall biosynthesis